MTTSGTTEWSLTARDIITAALQENAILPFGETPEAAETEACLLRLNAILKSWQIGLQLQAEATVTVPGGSASGTIAEDVETILSARLVQSATNQRTLARWERDEYLSLPNKASVGSPTIFYTAEQTDAATLYLWPVSATDITLKIDYLRKPETVTDINETVDLPQKYHEALYANLAVRCAGLFGVSPSQELTMRAERLRREAEDAERPAAYTMGAYY